MRNFCKSVLTFFCGRAITFIAPVSTQLLSALISSDILQRPAVALTWLNAALCFMVVLAYVATAVPGVTYPYLLEWMEGGTVDLIDRILAGKAIYAEPTLEHVAYIYPPFYYWVSSGVALLVGDQLLAARLVSLISTLVATAAIFWISRDALAACGFRDERNLYALLSAGLYLGCFELSGRWYHLARVDSLYLALLLTGFMLTRPRFGPVGSTAAGVMWACAFLTKQTAIVAMGPLLLSLLWIDLRRYLPAALACALIVSVSVLHLEFSTDGWFGYFVFELPRHHGLAIKVGTREFGLRDMLGQAAAATLAAALAGLMLPARLPARDWVPFWSFAFGMVASSWLSRVHVGGWYNVSMALYATVAILAPLGLRQLVEWAAALRPSAAVLPLCAGAIQLLALLHNPWNSIPAPEDIARMEGFINRLRAMPGDVMIFDMRSVQRAAGKSPYGLEMAARDVLRSEGQVRDDLYEALQNELNRQRFSAIILTPGHYYQDLEPALSQNYRPARRLFPDDAKHVLQGEVPNLVYVPRR